MRIFYTSLNIKRVCAAALLFLYSTTGLALDHTFYYGGRIINYQGKPLIGSMNIVINFFDAEKGGNQLNSGTYGGQATLADGVFQIPVDLSATDEVAIYGNAAVWIEFADQTDGTSYPRQRLNPVPYALRVPVDGASIVFNSSGNLQVGSINITQITGLSGLLAAKADVAYTGSMTMGSGSTLALGSFTVATEPSMITGLTAADKGKTWFNTTTNQIKYWDGSSAQVVGASGAGLTNFNGQSGNTQLLAIGTTGTAPAWNSAANTHTLNIPMSSAAGVTAGLVSNADYSSFSAAATKTGYLTVTAATNLDTIRSSISSASSANSNLTLVQRDGTGGFNAATIAAETKLSLKDGTTHWLSLVAPGAMPANMSYTLPATATAGALLTTDASGNLSWITPAAAVPVTSVAGRTGAITLTTADVAEGANLYYTNARAQAAAVADALNNGITNVAPSQNAVFNAIAAVNTSVAAKEPTITAGTNTQYYRGDKSWQTLNSDVVPQGSSNLYFTIAGARGAVSGAAPLSYSVGSGAFTLTQATTATDGYLSSTDWNTFNDKQAALGFTPVNKTGDAMTGTLTLNTANQLRFNDTANDHYVGFAAPTTLTGNKIWVLPPADGSPGQVLKTDGSGNLAWIAPGGTPPVTTVAGRTGDITLTSSDVSEGSNFYYTDARAQTAAVAATITSGVTTSAPSQNAVYAALATRDTTIATKEPAITAGATTQYYRGDKSWQTLNSDAVPQGSSNLYFTIAGARGAVSATAPLSYSMGTGAFSIGLSAGAPMSYDSGTGAFTLAKATTSTDGYLAATDWNTFNGKIGLGSLSATGPLSYNNGTGAFTIAKATTSADGYLASSDWNSFSGKVSSQWTTSAPNISYSTGNVGIGTTVTVFPLTVQGAMNVDNAGTNPGATRDITFGNSVSTEGIGSKRTAGPDQYGIDFYTSGTPRLTIMNDGNIGIGTTVTGSLLQIDTANASNQQVLINYPTSTAGGGRLEMGYDSTDYGRFQAWSYGGSKAVNLSLQPAGGNVGIGTTNPGFPLEVRSSTGNAQLAVSNSSAGANATVGTDYYVNGTMMSWIGAWINNTGPSASFEISTAGPTGSVDPRITIDGSGNVGIGTTAPGDSLHVGGTTGLLGTGGIMRLSASTNAVIAMGNYNASPWGGWIQSVAWNNDAAQWPLTLQPQGGNVGIGSIAPTVALDVAGAGRFSGGVGTVTLSTQPGSNFTGIGAASTWYLTGESLTITVPAGPARRYRLVMRQTATNGGANPGTVIILLNNTNANQTGTVFYQGMYNAAWNSYSTTSAEKYVTLAGGSTTTYYVWIQFGMTPSSPTVVNGTGAGRGSCDLFAVEM